MIKKIILCISLLNPFIQKPNYINLTNFNEYKNQITAMVKPQEKNYQLLLGDVPSKIANSAVIPKEGCIQTASTEYHNDRSKTITKTVACSSKEKYDKSGKLKKKTNTNQPKFQIPKKDFFGEPSEDKLKNNK